jgi:hypothetical protein
MADHTTNYNLKKPLQTEYYDVDDFNANADILDAGLKAAADRAKAAEIFIAASDSPQKFKNIADYICAADDETVFQGAVTALEQSGGKIIIAPGSYDIRRFVQGGGNIVYEGIGEVNIDNDLGIVNGGRAVFKNIAFNKMLVGGDAESVVFENCKFAAQSCIQVSRGNDDSNVPNIYAKGCEFEYTGSGEPSLSVRSTFLVYVQYASMDINVSIVGCKSNIKAYLPRRFTDTQRIIKGAGNINIDTLCPEGTAVIGQGNTSVIKDISKYGGNMTNVDFIYDTDNFGYSVDIISADYGTGSYVPIQTAISVSDKKAAFTVALAAADDITISYKIRENAR